ncbi:hypothetical protein [Hymenobacter coccineus]|uniref:Uncharacterized protein n=1 Tax=Hymenobacter coccineus TaxID=1908235 RepID=A0A1G1SU74_9BACT|nr:hypothetical protein [Hymenobacter coccineus]OGX82162.1 hypothetical protein BEN49_14455 [Hymenobacter coccineus]
MNYSIKPTLRTMELGLLDKIKRLVIVALVSDDELMETLVPKRGNALSIAHEVGNRLAYNHAKRLKVLRGLTPHEFVCAQWQKNLTLFTCDPTHLTLGLYI